MLYESPSTNKIFCKVCNRYHSNWIRKMGGYLCNLCVSYFPFEECSHWVEVN